MADSLYQVAEELAASGNADSALLIHEQALKIRQQLPPSERLVESYRKVGLVYLAQFKYPVADSYLERARTLSDSVEIDPELRIRLYFEVAACKTNMRDFPMTLTFLRRALDWIARDFPTRNDLRADAHGLLSAAYYNSADYLNSISHARQAIALSRNDQHRRLANYYTTLGMAYQETGQRQQAMESLDRAIVNAQAWAGFDSDAVAIRYVQKAAILTAMGAYDSAYYYLERNLDIRKRTYGFKHVNTFGALYSLAKLYSETGLPDSAARYYQLSLTALIRDFNNLDLRANPKPQHDEVNTDLVLGLTGKASALSKGKATLALALETYFKADSVFDVYRRNFISDANQLTQLELGYIPYGEMMDIAFTLMDTSDSAAYVQDAVAILEKSRATVLRNALLRAQSYGRAGLPENLLRRENRLIGNRQQIIQAIARQPDAGQLDSLYEQLLIVNDSHQQLLQEVETISPPYYSIRYDDEPTDVNKLKTFLDKRNSILVEYLWNDKTIHAVMISPDTILARRIDVTPGLREALQWIRRDLVRGFADIFDKNRFNNYCRHAHFLYDQLIAWALKDDTGKSKLIISADGLLESFPFEVLLREMPSGRVVDYRLPYLALDHEISYTFSSKFLLQSRHPATREGLLAFAYTGDPTTQLLQRLPFLPGAGRELDAIREAVGDNGGNNFLLGERATESAFKSSVNRFGMVHLAVHGVADTVNALESRLVFRNDTDTIDDGSLYTYELYDLDLRNLRFAVLSACESGIGKRQSGEGVMSMARGFAYGGCPSMVMSLWRINDQASASIMGDFYRHLASGEDVDVALALAKRDYLEEVKEFDSHPGYWAAFIAIGDVSPPFQGQYKWVYVIVIALVAAVGIVLRRLVKPSSSSSPSSPPSRSPEASPGKPESHG